MTQTLSLSAIKLAGLILIGMGVLMVLSVFTPLRVVLELFLDLAFWGGDRAPIADSGLLITGIAGAVMAGWGLTMWCLSTHIGPAQPMAGRRILLPGLVLWFVLDGAASVMAGAWFNTILNTAVLAVLLALILRPAGAPPQRTA